MDSVATSTIEDGIGILTIDSPPVNALGLKVRTALDAGIRAFLANSEVKAIVLICEGRTFFAGADIAEFGAPQPAPNLQSVINVIDNAAKPVIAAMHGTALGGGYELALACHFRIAVPSAKVGLPEVKLGLLPGAGGTQRLPRLVGAAVALEIIGGGAPLSADRALELGMIDALAEEGRLRDDTVAFARAVVARGGPLHRVRDRQDKVDPDKGNAAIFADYRDRTARATRGFKAPGHIVQAIEAAVALPFTEGMVREAELYRELHDSIESAAQRYFFFAERDTAKIPDVPSSTPTIPIRTIGVIGAGTMGGGIAMNFLDVGIPVTLVETDQAALDRGLATIRRNYENTARKGRLTQEQVKQRLSLIRPTLSLALLAEADLIIEAVFEEMAIKKDVFGRLDAIAKDSAILASNTSFLDIDEIAATTQRPERVIGLHFFSPANVMRLLEIVRGAKTSNEVIATATKLAKQIRKVPVLARVCPGFIANRVMAPRKLQAEVLILEGSTPKDVDKTIYDFGFAMGPFQMLDLVGLDVIGRGNAERSIAGDLIKEGRLGLKKNGGYYDYDAARSPSPSPVAARIIAEFSKWKGLPHRGPQPPEEIIARLLYPVVNEGARILEEGIAIRASDIDVACILGYNWPVFTGGPMFWADTIGLPRIVSALKTLEARYGGAFRPSDLLKAKAASGGSFTRR